MRCACGRSNAGAACFARHHARPFGRGVKPSGCDYLNHWSSSFHAIQILESVQKLLLQTFGSLPADLFESPRGHPTDCSFIAIYMLKTSLISLDCIFRGKHPVLVSGFSLSTIPDSLSKLNGCYFNHRSRSFLPLSQRGWISFDPLLYFLGFWPYYIQKSRRCPFAESTTILS